MKYKSKETRGNGDDVYMFAIGKAEVMILMDLLSEAYRNTPRSIFTQPFTSRVDSMKTSIVKMMKEVGIRWPIKRQDLKLGDKEIL